MAGAGLRIPDGSGLLEHHRNLSRTTRLEKGAESTLANHPKTIAVAFSWIAQFRQTVPSTINQQD